MTSHKKSLVCTCAAILAPVAVLATDGVHDGFCDGLKFDLRFVGSVTPGEPSTYGSIVDGTTWSAADGQRTAAKVSAFAGDASTFGTPTPVSIQTIDYAPPAYAWTQESAPVLYLPQPMGVASDGAGGLTTNYFPQSVRFPKPIVLGSNVSFRVRVRWDGNLRQAWEQIIFDNGTVGVNGFSFCTYMPGQAALTKDSETIHFRLHVGGQEGNMALALPRNEWYDFVFILEYRPDVGDAGHSPGTVAHCFWCRADASAASYPYRRQVKRFDFAATTWANKFAATPCDSAGVPQGDFVIGGGLDPAQNTGWAPAVVQVPAKAVGGSFRGAIAKLQFYDRALTDAEALAILHESDGADISVGSVNGSADEFAAADDAGLAEMFEPLAMPARRMRKQLDAEHPALTLKFPMHPEEAGLARVLCLTPILADTGSSVPLEVYVNGVLAGTADLAQASGRAVFLRKKNMQRDADGNVTVRIVRPGTPVGVVGVDALKLVGGWAVGQADGLSSDWCFRDGAQIASADNSVNRYAWSCVGAPYGVATWWKGVSGMKNDSPTTLWYPATTMAFDVPEAVAERPCRYEMVTASAYYGKTTLDVYLNGRLHASGLMPAKKGDVLGVDFEPGTLNPGINYLTVSNATYNYHPGEQPQYAGIEFDGHRFTVEPPPLGLMILLK